MGGPDVSLGKIDRALTVAPVQGSSMALGAGTQLGPYRILSALGAGGMGEVYRAKDTRLGREVAVKVLPEELAEEERVDQRFEREWPRRSRR